MTTRFTQLLTGTTLGMSLFVAAPDANAEHYEDRPRRPEPVRYDSSKSTAVGFRIQTPDFGVSVGYRDSRGGDRIGVNVNFGEQRRWIPAHYEERHVQVLVQPAHYVDRHTQVLVERGHYIDRHTQVLVEPGHYVDRHTQVLVEAAHWEERKVAYVAVPGHYEMQHIPAVTKLVRDHCGRLVTVVVSPQRCERVWVPDQIAYRCEKVWVADRFEKRCEKVWVPDRFETRCEKVWVPDRYETRCEKVLVPARYETRCEKVLVPGRWETCR